MTSQATCFVYFWVAAVSLREGSFSLAEKAKKCLFIPFVVTLIQEELLRKTRGVIFLNINSSDHLLTGREK